MSKLKNPLLSLGAQGTIGDALTLQKRGQTTIVREKPIPAYRRTLPQVYQRWLYEDYAYLWTQQTAVIKRQCAATGSRFHLTGFQYWMKLMLSTLPDIVGMWHLDERTGTLAKDFSKHGNNGTIYGATPVVGIIDFALSFDGINDYVNCGQNPSLNLLQAFTLESFVNTADKGANTSVVYSRNSWNLAFRLDGSTWGSAAVLYINVTGYGLSGALVGYWNKIVHWAVTFDDPHDTVQIFRNGIRIYITTTATAHIPNVVADTFLGSVSTGTYVLKGIQDDTRLYNRILDATEILRHSKRRYPP